ncbi:hypothetical protein PIB30_089109 [Stylosanthes scabra]|uniref:Putative plant transposon protein domain-containing protein n=1 Tax=Stylosanthes scabra TaxID=79078 RepID=A0ABU6WSB3_9FABA|nr:hypothetical protein [Stylosanthes scabra]
MASSSSDMLDAHCFWSQYHQDLFEEHLAKKSETPETCFELQEDEYPEIQEEIAKRGWRKLSKPRTKISKSYVKGVTIDFFAANIRDTLRIHHLTPRAQTDFKTRQMEDQRLDEVIRDICILGARWKMSSSQPDQPIQLRRQDLTPLARGWAELIINSIIPIRNKSEIIVPRAILIHSIIKGDDVRVEELISDNIAIIVEGVQGRGKLIFPSTIYRLCKEAGVPFWEFRDTKYIPIEKPITARVIIRTRGRNANYIQEQHMEEEDHMQPDYNEGDYSKLKVLKTKQDEMHTQQNNFYRQIGKEQGEMAKEIEEIKKFQVNQILMGFCASPLDKTEKKIHETRNEIIEMSGQIKEWTRNASTREAYYCWAHQQANPNLVPIPACEIAKFVNDNAVK